VKWWLLAIGLATCAGAIAICVFNIHMAFKDQGKTMNWLKLRYRIEDVIDSRLAWWVAAGVLILAIIIVTI
jgi:hypothetical protein